MPQRAYRYEKTMGDVEDDTEGAIPEPDLSTEDKDKAGSMMPDIPDIPDLSTEDAPNEVFSFEPAALIK